MKSFEIQTGDGKAMKRILGYTDKLTVRPGEQIEFKISAQKEQVSYRAQLVRLINGDTQSSVAGFKEIEIPSSINGTYQARHQPIVNGSCIVVEETGPLAALDEWTMALAFMSTTPGMDRPQHLVSHWDQSLKAGWSLHLSKEGHLCFTNTDGLGRVTTVRAGEAVVAGRWYRACVRVSWVVGTITLGCSAIVGSPMAFESKSTAQNADISGEPPEISAPLMIAAAFGGLTVDGRCIPVDSFNGRIEAPAMYLGVLTDRELEVVMGGARPQSLQQRLVADWDFSLEISSTVIRDRSTNGLHGYTYNLPLRAVKGTRWSGAEMSWRHSPDHYGAIHFHTDDLYDCGWQTDLHYTVPEDLRSGVYALRLRVKDEAARTIQEDHEEYLPFFVAAPKGRPTSRLAFLVPTYTYVVYGNVRMVGEAHRKSIGLSEEAYYGTICWVGLRDYAVALGAHPELGISTYDHHLDGSPVHTASWLRPLMNLRPKGVLWNLCADLLLTDWLEAQQIDYDVITDDLLQAEGLSLLKQYQVVMTGNHPEYHTTAQWDAIESYLSQGGRLMYMGGNGFYWRCATQTSTPAVIEVRRGITGTRTWTSNVGECYHAFSGECGGIWRDIGRPPQRLVGVGFIAHFLQALRDESYYRITPEARAGRAAFILEGIESEVFGEEGIFGSAAGVEIDKTDVRHGTPGHAIVVAHSENHSSNMFFASEEMHPGYPLLSHYRTQTYAEVVFFETPAGGAVFSVGSMAWCGSLGHNGYENNVARMTTNVLKRLLDPTPFEIPAQYAEYARGQ